MCMYLPCWPAYQHRKAITHCNFHFNSFHSAALPDMGVKDLWPILSPVEMSLPLSALSGKTLAVDLSGWVCESYGARGLASAVKRPHLRNLLFRTLRLSQLGVKLVFVMDGTATQLKWEVMDRRERGRGGSEECGQLRARKTGTRPMLDMNLRECALLLGVLGLPCLQSCGEAEAFCALLNAMGLVDGVITQDTDSFLYGAAVVYKDISTDEKDPCVNCYSMEAIKVQLGLTRHDLIGLALLLGCDYDHGVPGVGKETVLRLVNACRSHDESCDLLQRYECWKRHEFSLVQEISQVEEQVWRKASSVTGFPNKQVLDEFLSHKDKIPSLDVLQWRMPDVTGAMSLCLDKLDWPVDYSSKKLVTLATQWMLRMVPTSKQPGVVPIGPTKVLHRRIRKGHAYYEVEWGGELVNKIEALLEGGCGGVMCTLEDAVQLETAYPDLCRRFQEEQEAKKKGKKQTKKCVQPALEGSSAVISGVVSKVSGGVDMKEKWSKGNISKKDIESCADSRPVADHRPDGERSRLADLKPQRYNTSMKYPQSKNDMLSKDGDQMLLKDPHKSNRVGTVSTDIHSNAVSALSLLSGRDGALVKKHRPKIADGVSAQAVGNVLGLDSEVSASSGVQWSEDTDDIPPLMMRLGRMALGTSTIKSASLPAAAGTTANPIVID